MARRQDRLAPIPTWLFRSPFSRNRRAHFRAGHRSPTSAIENRNSSTLTNDCHPASSALFTRRSCAPRSARAVRAGYPAGHTPVARACLRTDRSAAEPARCKAPEPTRPLNQTPLSLTRDSSHWRAMNGSRACLGSAPARRANGRTFERTRGAFSCKGNPPSFFDPPGPA